MAKSKKRQKQMAEKRARKRQMYERMDTVRPDGDSSYARKKRYCDKNGVWGFEVPEPKPWKRFSTQKAAA